MRDRASGPNPAGDGGGDRLVSVDFALSLRAARALAFPVQALGAAPT